MDAEALLQCWERGRRRHSLDRGLLLFSMADPATDPEVLADRTLGERNAALLRLRQRMFGDEFKSCIECIECGERLEFGLNASDLLGRTMARAGHVASVDVSGQRIRMPTTRDLASIATVVDESTAASELLTRLCGTRLQQVGLDDISKAIDEADPCTDFTIELNCPACAHRWNAPFDIPSFIWDEIETCARNLLDEVHVLAREYGWDERRILGLSQSRRRAYLERVTA